MQLKLRQKATQQTVSQHEVSASFYLVWHFRGLFNLSPLSEVMRQIDWLQVADSMLSDDSDTEIYVEPTSNDRLRVYVRKLVKIPVSAEIWEALTQETPELQQLREIAAQKRQKRVSSGSKKRKAK